ncbi:MarR family winged helix-turn-helix transcriptional regulator [Miltoncostaea marina]|uniref:MarR family winged helix-turn-helix transcriptional regulator n=1 Tax=Miltoncostaea marina TaxID=2843215 RepID=UPI001C3E81BB|nr:MarR family transcriptional regulator [Miltoncostaea marina]
MSAIAAWGRLMGSHAAMTRSFNAELQRASGLTVTDFEVLRRLAEEPEARMRRVDLAQAVGLTPSGITRLLDGLQSAGLVRKEACESDARVTYAAITPEGRAALSAATEVHLAALVALFGERFTAQELGTLVELLGRLPGAAEGERACTEVATA